MKTKQYNTKDICKEVVHILPGRAYHLSPNIACSYLENIPQFNHVVVLYGKNVNKKKYSDRFALFKYEKYFFIKNALLFVVFILKHRKSVIIFHSGEYWQMLVCIASFCRSINWVCWGSGCNQPESFIGKKIVWLKKFIYSRLSKIVVLMTPDKLSLETYYMVSANKIQVIPYMGVGYEKADSIYNDLRQKHVFAESGKVLVLLGNNNFSKKSYIDLVKRLSVYKGKILVQCMLHYSLNKDKEYYELLRIGKDIFGEDFRSNEEFYEKNEEYVRYMNKCDIYICGVEKQTGLGAIGACLRLGKKVYITGNNYDWITSNYHAKVFRSDDIKESLPFEEFAKDLTFEEREYNYNCMKQKTTVELWKSWLSNC